jgi:long-chain acyl-CoA synthetase
MKPRSLGALLRASAGKFGDKPAMLAPDKDGFRPISYRELYDLAHRYAGVLRSFGLARGDRLVILSENAPEWAITDWACQTLGIVVVPIYPTLPADQAQYIVRDCEAKVVVAGDESQREKVAGLDEVRTILLKGAEDSLGARAARGEGEIPRDEWEREIDLAQPDDVCSFIYTSGTTGNPKGAMLEHGGFLWVCEAVLNNLPIDEKDTFLTFLPMSHVFERVDGQVLPISLGSTIAYSKNLMTLANDMANAKPTVMLVVPRFLEATREKILGAMEKAPPIRQRLFRMALAQGAKRFRGEFAPLAPVLDRLVGTKIRDRVGGRLRFFVAGGAALAPHVAEFYGAFGLKILQGYGLTESTGGVVVNHPDRNKYWTVGEVLPGVECKLAEDGEILFRGPAVMRGYHNLPEETEAAIDADGWLHTGDIGEFEGKHLKITDRKKDLIVLGNGKNVAPQPIENRLKASPLIQEAVLFGDGMDHVVALIVPQHEAVRTQLGRPENAPLAEDKEARALIKKEMERTNAELAPFEKVKKFELLEAPFSIESGELTPTLKVKRKVVRERFADKIEAMR